MTIRYHRATRSLIFETYSLNPVNKITIFLYLIVSLFFNFWNLKEKIFFSRYFITSLVLLNVLMQINAESRLAAKTKKSNINRSFLLLISWPALSNFIGLYFGFFTFLLYFSLQSIQKATVGNKLLKMSTTWSLLID